MFNGISQTNHVFQNSSSNYYILVLLLNLVCVLLSDVFTLQIVWVGYATAGALVSPNVSKHTCKVISAQTSLSLCLSPIGRELLCVLSEGVVTRDGHPRCPVCQIAAGSVDRPPTMGSGCFRHQICSSKLAQVGSHIQNMSQSREQMLSANKTLRFIPS